MELRRTLEEIHTLYKLEPELRDLYVEGHTDAHFFRWYLNSRGITAVSVYPADQLDVPEEILKKHSLQKCSSRGRLLAFSYELANSPASQRVFCIADRDFDRCCGRAYRNACLNWTDGNSLELYALTRTVFRKFLALVLGWTAMSSEEFLSQCVAVLQRIYAIRAANEAMEWKMSWIPFGRYVIASSSIIELNETSFIKAYLQKNDRWADRDIFSEKVEEIASSFHDDHTRNIRGHDVAELLHVIVKKLKKDRKFGNAETLERCLMATVETQDLEDHGLFKALRAFCERPISEPPAPT